MPTAMLCTSDVGRLRKLKNNKGVNKVKLTNGEIYNAKEPFQQLAAQKFPVLTSLAIVKVVQKLNEHLVPFEQVRTGLIKTYGTVNPDKPQEVGINPSDENFAKFAAEYTELLSQEVEVVIDKVKLPASLEIEPAILVILEKFITVEENSA